MKTIITAVNAKYIHTSLSVRCLQNYVKDIVDCEIKEYSINDSVLSIVSDLVSAEPDCVAFSCYIWNIEIVLKTASSLKKIMPDLTIVLGGHEVTYNSEDILKENGFIDAVIRGEGEIPLKKYLLFLQDKNDMSELRSVTYRKENDIIYTPDETEFCDLDELEFPYDEDIEKIKNKIIYYESSRGCPYNCTYCLSGDNSRVRFLDVEKVKEHISFFSKHGVKIVKFVDRTFNAGISRAKEIFRYISQNPGETVFHMEIAGDIIDDETIDILSKIKDGAVRFEIGVQTVNPNTMSAIHRTISLDKLKRNVILLREKTGVHIHLDLIAGLPYEDINSMKKSFNEVILLKPHVLQLGFLKLLKGSEIRNRESEFGYEYNDFPPYEVISNDFVTYKDIMEVKAVEDKLDKYYNSGKFSKSMDYLFEKTGNPYSVFLILEKYSEKNFERGTAFSTEKLYDILVNCFGDFGEEFTENVKYDYLRNFRVGKRPVWFGDFDNTLLQRTYELMKNEEYKMNKFPAYYDVPAKEIMKHIRPEKFSWGIMLFDYRLNTVYDITDDISFC